MAARDLLVCEGDIGGKLRCVVLQTSKQRQPRLRVCLSERDYCYVKGQGLWENKLVLVGQFPVSLPLSCQPSISTIELLPRSPHLRLSTGTIRKDSESLEKKNVLETGPPTLLLPSTQIIIPKLGSVTNPRSLLSDMA